MKRLSGWLRWWDKHECNAFPFLLLSYCALIDHCLIGWIWPFALFVGGGGVRAEDQEPPDQGEETAGQGWGVPRGAGGHPPGWVFPQPPIMGLKGPPQYRGLHHIKTGLNHHNGPQRSTSIHLSGPHHIKTGPNGTQWASKCQKRLQRAYWASVVINRT